VAAPRTFDDKRARIAALAEMEPSQALPELRRFLGDKNSYLVGEAAQVASKLGLRELGPDLAAAFMRILEEGAKNDQGCLVKCRLVEALLALDAYEPDVYLKGLRHVQREPSGPKIIDTATGLRGLCAHALFQMDRSDALLDVAPLLADPEPICRAEAASAIGRSGIQAAAAVLHLKALRGDSEPDVLGACYRGLLRLVPARYLPFVEAALRGAGGGDPEAAALALGESRLPEALPVLKEALSYANSELRSSVLLGIALLRLDAANDLLISLVENGPMEQAAAALGPLALSRHDEKLAKRVEDAVSARKSKKLEATFREKFSR
jgi:HEAT repeat protein